jgi:hypothetical protein
VVKYLIRRNKMKANKLLKITSKNFKKNNNRICSEFIKDNILPRAEQGYADYSVTVEELKKKYGNFYVMSLISRLKDAGYHVNNVAGEIIVGWHK